MKKILKRITIFTLFILFILMVINWHRISMMNYPLKIIDLEGYSNIHFVPETKKLTVEKAYVISFAPKNRKTLLKLLEEYQQENPLSSYLDSTDFDSLESLDYNLWFYKESRRVNRFETERSGYAGGDALMFDKRDYIGFISYVSSKNRLSYHAFTKNGNMKTHKKREIEYEHTLEEFINTFK